MTLTLNGRRWLRALGVASALALAAPAWAQHDAAAHSPKRRPPALAMSAAFAPDGALWVVGLDAQGKLFTQRSSDEGRSWAPARGLDSGSDKIAADGENRPKIAFAPAGAKAPWAVITYTEPLARPYTGQIRMLRSSDGGQAFSAPFTVHQDRQLITHRFESVAFDARGVLHTAWIDKRDLEALAAAAPAPAEAASAAGRSGRRAKPVVDYRGAAVYRNESTDGGLSFGPDTKLADHSCECCRIALSPAPDGSLVALWRHVFGPNERDHAFAPLAGPAKEPVRASFDHWALDACPHHGPGLAPAAAGGYHAVWFGVRAGVGAVRYSRLTAQGAPQGEVRPLPDERAEHAAIATAGSLAVVAWRSFDGQATAWRAWVSKDDGQSFALHELGRSAEDNDHPLLLARGDHIVALWLTAGGIHVETIRP